MRDGFVLDLFLRECIRTPDPSRLSAINRANQLVAVHRQRNRLPHALVGERPGADIHIDVQRIKGLVCELHGEGIAHVQRGRLLVVENSLPSQSSCLVWKAAIVVAVSFIAGRNEYRRMSRQWCVPVRWAFLPDPVVLAGHAAELFAPGTRALTHCNAGGLATAGYGSAVGSLRAAWERGLLSHVFVDETRPLLQGSRLTAFELEALGIPHAVIADSAAASLMAAGEIDCAVTGADRIAANGDTANKIGTYSVAVAAAHHGIPLYVVAPTSTIDLDTRPPVRRSRSKNGTRRDHGPLPCTESRVRRHAARAVAAIVTELGIHRAPYAESLAALT